MNPRHGAGPSYDRGISLNTMIVVSVAVHIMVLTGGAFLKLSSTPRMTFGPVYSVQLVSSGAVSAPPASSLAQEITQAESRDRGVIIKKQSEILSKIPAPVKKMERAETRNPQVDQAIERLKKKVGSETAAVPQRMQGRPQSSGGDSRVNDYSRMIESRIKSQWVLPGGIVSKQNIRTTVHFRILRNGALTGISIQKRSGNVYLDSSALRAVEKSNPLPPLPEGIGDSLDVSIDFHSSELR